MGINSKWRLGLGIVGFFLLCIWSGILSYLLSASFFRLFTWYFYSSSLQSSQVIFLNSPPSSQSVFSLGSRSGSFYALSIIFTAFLPSSSPLTSSMLTVLLCNTIVSVLCGSCRVKVTSTFISIVFVSVSRIRRHWTRHYFSFPFQGFLLWITSLFLLCGSSFLQHT